MFENKQQVILEIGRNFANTFRYRTPMALTCMSNHWSSSNFGLYVWLWLAACISVGSCLGAATMGSKVANVKTQGTILVFFFN